MSSSDAGWNSGSGQTGQAPPGWYADPREPRAYRYWDGYRWTDYVQRPTAAAPVGAGWLNQYSAPAVARGTDGLAVASLLCAIFGVVVLGAIFGFVALHRIKHSGNRGRGMAIAGLVISGVWLLIIVGAVAGLLAYQSGVATDSGGRAGPISGIVAAADLHTGECLSVPPSLPAQPLSFVDTPCGAPHNGEVIDVGSYPSASYPGEQQAEARVRNLCRVELAAFAGSPTTKLHVVYLYPTQRSWDSGARTYTCIAVNRQHEVVGSMRDTG